MVLTTGESEMRVLKKIAAASAAAMLISQPCLAADDHRDIGARERRSGAFAGLNVRLPMGKGNPGKASAKVQLTTLHQYRTGAGAVVRAYRPDGLELGLSRSGGASLSIAGQDLRRANERVALKGSTTTYLIVGGVLLAVVVLAMVASAIPQPGPRPDAFD
jgi:hypothetical protein